MNIKTTCFWALTCLFFFEPSLQAAPAKLCIDSAKGTVLSRARCRRSESAANLANISGLLGLDAQINTTSNSLANLSGVVSGIVDTVANYGSTVAALSSQLTALDQATPTFYFARVAQDGTLTQGSTGVTSLQNSTGRYNVNFPVDIRSCYWLVSKAPDNDISNDLTLSWTITRNSSDANSLLTVRSWRNFNDDGLVDSAFTLSVMCL